MLNCGSTFRSRGAGGQPERDVGRQRSPRQQPRFLEDDRTARVDPANRVPVDLDPPIGRTIQTGDDPQQCRFAATRRPEQRDYLARCDLDVDVVQHGVRSERSVDTTN